MITSFLWQSHLWDEVFFGSRDLRVTPQGYSPWTSRRRGPVAHYSHTRVRCGLRPRPAAGTTIASGFLSTPGVRLLAVAPASVWA
jgi:hypothetical protein